MSASLSLRYASKASSGKSPPRQFFSLVSNWFNGAASFAKSLIDALK